MSDPALPDGVFVGAERVHLRSYRWEARGRAKGTVLIVHGLSEHAARWAPVASHLAAAGFNVFAFDQRGHGRSEGEHGRLGSFDHLVEDADRARKTALESFPGSGSAFLYGHSLGALVVLRYVQTYRPETPGVLLSAPWLKTAVPIPLWKRVAARVLGVLAPDFRLSSKGEPERLTRDPVAQKAYATDPLVHRRISPRLFDEVRRAQRLALGQGIDASFRTLVLIPLADSVTDPEVTERWARAIDGSHVRIETLPGVLHEPHNDIERDRVLALVTDWLETSSAERA